MVPLLRLLPSSVLGSVADFTLAELVYGTVSCGVALQSRDVQRLIDHAMVERRHELAAALVCCLDSVDPVEYPFFQERRGLGGVFRQLEQYPPADPTLYNLAKMASQPVAELLGTTDWVRPVIAYTATPEQLQTATLWALEYRKEVFSTAGLQELARQAVRRQQVTQVIPLCNSLLAALYLTSKDRWPSPERCMSDDKRAFALLVEQKQLRRRLRAFDAYQWQTLLQSEVLGKVRLEALIPVIEAI